jgi:hypothetical protein
MDGQEQLINPEDENNKKRHDYLDGIFQQPCDEETLYEHLRDAIIAGHVSLRPGYLPASNDVFTIMFIHKELSEPLISAITNKQIILKDLIAEHNNDLAKAAEQGIRVDVFLRDIADAFIYTLDMQRRYKKEHVRNRNIYYAAKELGDQKVDNFEYENLKQVSVTFILEKNTTPGAPALAKIQYMNVETHEVYSDLVTLYELNLNQVHEEKDLPEIFYMLADFLTAKTHEDLIRFINRYNTGYSKRLVVEYMKATLDENVLQKLDGGKFAEKKYQDLLLKREEDGIGIGREEGLDLSAKVIGALKKNMPVNEIAERYHVTIHRVEQLQSLLAS